MALSGEPRALAIALLSRWARSRRPRSTTTAPTADDFFNGDVLHEIRLAINSKDWNALRTSYLEDNTYYPCDFTWKGVTCETSASARAATAAGAAPSRGSASTSIATRRTQKFLGLKSVILDNGTQDPSMMKERLSTMFLARLEPAGVARGARRLYVNNEYFGLYVIVESIDKDFLTRVFGENEGYLFEYNYVYDWRFDYLGADLENYKEVFDSRRTRATRCPRSTGRSRHGPHDERRERLDVRDRDVEVPRT